MIGRVHPGVEDDRPHALALAVGGTDAGGPQPHGHGACVRDPDGNEPFVACHSPEAG
ncbi:hypothetical protein [Amaricoccus sp.]|uniref:hypothetical protein n=1 Tax=Amaricoccus sp. TaxID=1872485 RepID=UPI001B5CBC08|nr:hypothetical protein [Amaricoccus sp.]MBP7241959.1 hypothetical protein [Amaricoccus sp.]